MVNDMKKKINIVIVTLLMFSMLGCSSDEKIENFSQDNENDSIVIEEDFIENDVETIDDYSDVIPYVINESDTYINDGECLACVIADGLRQRRTPNGEIYTEENYYNGNHGTETREEDNYAELGCYQILGEESVDDNDWYKINSKDYALRDEDTWIAYTKLALTKKNYVAHPSADLSKYQDREQYDDAKPLLSPYYETLKLRADECVTRYSKLTNEEEDLILFLLKTLPGIMNCEYYNNLNFDSRIISEEEKTRLLNNIACLGVKPCPLWEYGNYFKENDYYDKLNSLHTADGYYFLFKEHVDYYTNKYYGTTYDFSTVATYDPENDIYIVPGLNGLGDAIPYVPYLIDYQIDDDDVITATIAIFDTYYGLDFYGLKGDNVTKEEADAYAKTINNYEVKIINSEGGYKLITVKKI